MAHHLDGKIKRLDGLPKFEKFQNCFSNTEIVARPMPKFAIWMRVPENLIVTKIKTCKAYK
jgi:hypothetical protein